MTHDELTTGVERAEGWFRRVPGVTDEMVEKFIEEGFLSFADLTFVEAAQLADLAGVTEEQAEEMIVFAEEEAERVEQEDKIAKAQEAERAETEAATPAPVKSGEPTVADIFPETTNGELAEPKITAEQLFGSDNDAAAEQPPVAADQIVNVSESQPTTNGEANDEERKEGE